MLKEIHEQPKAVKDTICRYVKSEDGAPQVNFTEAGLTGELLAKLERIYFVACGS